MSFDTFPKDFKCHIRTSSSKQHPEMCTVNDADYDGLACMEPKSKDTICEQTCMKCKTTLAVVQIMQIRHGYCKECFLAYVNHKFRSTLGKSKIMKPGDKVLVAFSGSIKGRVLLHLIKSGLSEKSHKRFLFNIIVLYIDDGSAVGLSLTERQSRLISACEFVKNLDFNGFFTTINSNQNTKGDAIYVPMSEVTDTSISDEKSDLLLSLENSKSLTSKDDLIRHFRRQLMIEAARALHCDKVFVADCATDLAVQILSDVSLGRGAQLQSNVAFKDSRFSDVTMLRPMRELSRKEISFYSVFNNFPRDSESAGIKNMSDIPSVQNLSENFVMDLMENFPSTVSTILRTGEKLESGCSVLPGSTELPEENKCALCEAYLDTPEKECSSMTATEFSHTISSVGPNGFDHEKLQSTIPATDNVQKGKSCSCSSQSTSQNCVEKQLSFDDIEMLLCYGCRLMVHDLGSPCALPRKTLDAILKKKASNEMLNQIKDFLL